MKPTGLLIMAMTLALVGQAWANDLESILDEAGQQASAKAEKNLNSLEKVPPFLSAMKKAIGTPTSEQNIFLRYLEANDWEKVVLQFPTAFEGTAFQKSANGRALFGLAQFRAGLPVTGVQTLFMATVPTEIHELLQQEWRTAAPFDHFVWDIAKVPWVKSWENVFGPEQGFRVKVNEMLSAEGVTVEQLESLSAEAPTDSLLKGRVDWQLALKLAMKDQGDQAAKVLARLMRNPKAPVSKDLMQITAARLLFQNGYFDASIKYYEKVSKKSEYWTEAQEEMAWSYIRKGEPNNAKAVSQSLVNPGLAYQISPEAFFIRSLAQLKVCDYKGVIDTLGQFPKRFKERTKNLEKMTVEANVTGVNKGIQLLKNSKIQLQELGKTARELPRRFSHDEKLLQFAQVQKHLEDEARAAESLYAKSLALTGLQAVFDSIKQSSLQRAQSAKAASYDRVKELAKTEVEETKEILRKLHIVEAEVIQQVSLADRITKNAASKTPDEKRGVTGYKGQAEVVKFPAEEEVWFDEISNYRVDIKKACTVKR